MLISRATWAYLETVSFMSPADSKRREARRGAASSNVPTHVFQGAKDSAASSASNSARQDVLAPPPRAQLTSSPSPEEQQASRTARLPRGSSAPSTRPATTTSTGSSTPATGAAENLIKEKDARIAKLERELNQLAQNESESASFWQAKHSALHQHFLRMDTELRLVKEELRARETEAENAARGWQDVMVKEMAARDDEVMQLRAQVRGLKEWVSTSTRADGTTTTSDEVFADGWTRLRDGLQNWVITNYRKAKVDLSQADKATLSSLAELVPRCEELLDQGAKLHMLLSLLSRIITNLIFGQYFCGLPAAQELLLRQTESLMAIHGSGQAVRKWRSLTLSILNKQTTETMEIQVARIAENVLGNIEEMLDAITTDKFARDAAGSPTMEGKSQGIRQLVGDAIALSRLLVVQRVKIEIWMPQILPHRQLLFDPATMEDVTGEDEESLVQRGVSCVTFPGLIKRDDENGAQLQFRNVISKATVLCGPA